MSKAATDVDQHVGGRMRLRRTQLGFSQEKLAARLGVTFQQLQKYEGGANRISAGRLWEAHRELGVPVGYFYEGLVDDVDEGEQPPSTAIPAMTTEGLRLVRAFQEIEDAAMRRSITALVEHYVRSRRTEG